MRRLRAFPNATLHTQALGNRGAMGSVNCEEPKNQPLCQREDIRMFPTLKYYRNKRGTIYSKSRAEANLVQFVIEQSAEPVRWVGFDVPSRRLTVMRRIRD